MIATSLRLVAILFSGKLLNMKKKQTFPEKQQAKKDTKEKLCLENEILRLKLKAQCGSELQHTGNIPPEVEHQFLKNVLAFEESYANAKLISVFDFIGQPVIKKAEEIDDNAIEEKLEQLITLLADKCLTVDFGSLTDPRARYSFITEELFEHQINDIRIPGMFLHFMYEEFHPDHETEIRKKTLEFLSDWFERTMGKFSWELAQTFVMPEGNALSKEEVLNKFNRVFDSYIAFRDCKYLIDDIHFELKETEFQGLAHVDGGVKYNAVLENGETQFIEGPFKLFLAMEDHIWRIFYFIFPGFEW